ncbi:MAG: PLP-dependent aspartate aminotransferase family protein [Rhodopila sp.]|jgi:cystathionine gamma-lyase
MESNQTLNNPHGFATRSIHAGQPPDAATGAIVTPIYATSTFVQSAPGVNNGYDYARSGNPTRLAYELCIADLEGGKRAFAFSSGMAATATVTELLPQNAHIIASDDLYGGTYRLFSEVRSRSAGITVSYINIKDREALERAIRPETAMIWVETPSNPKLKVVDLQMIADVGRKRGILTVADNTFASPYLQRPLEHGFDIVVHSATKYLNGHSDIIGGVAVVGDRPELSDRLAYLQNAIGAIASPFDSFLAMRGLKTLGLRVRQHCANAQTIAEYLAQHPCVARVHYPGLSTHDQHDLARRQMIGGFGGMVTIELAGGLSESLRFLERLKIFALAVSLGGVESLIEHPVTMTHASLPAERRESLGLGDNLIRLSVGIEDVDDLVNDLDQALGSGQESGHLRLALTH